MTHDSARRRLKEIVPEFCLEPSAEPARPARDNQLASAAPRVAPA
jgi:hypothetical protein